MNDFILYISTAIALVFVIEGLFYALFPDAVRRMMAMAISLEPGQLRQMGMVMAAFGIIIVWGLRMLQG